MKATNYEMIQTIKRSEHFQVASMMGIYDTEVNVEQDVGVHTPLNLKQ